MKKKCVKCGSVAKYITDERLLCKKHSDRLIMKDIRKKGNSIFGSVLSKCLNKSINKRKTTSQDRL